VKALWLASLFSLWALGCASPARLQVMGEVERVRQGQAVVDARQNAPQAYARAELLRQRADQAFNDGDATSAQILSEQALAAYLRATIEARLTKAEARLAEALVLEKKQAERLAQLSADSNASPPKPPTSSCGPR
jgi:hypothetical protein